MTNPILVKAIETEYEDHLFRSRLEARWAVFFNELGVKWNYELEGFDLEGIRYLPDFYLPGFNYWIEIKPVPPTGEEQEKAKRLSAAFPEAKVFIFVGEPYPSKDTGYGYAFCEGQLVLNPTKEFMALTIHRLNFNDFQWVDDASSLFTPEALVRWSEVDGVIDIRYLIDWLAFLEESGEELIEIANNTRLMTASDFKKASLEALIRAFFKNCLFEGDFRSYKIESAAIAARQARFEHGENGGRQRQAPYSSRPISVIVDEIRSDTEALRGDRKI